jgi:hypothetical protein
VEVFAEGTKLLEAADRHHLEGIVSKRKASPLPLGREAGLAQDQDDDPAES